MKRIVILVLACVFVQAEVFSQDKWIAPEADAAKISMFMFNDDMVKEGANFYESSCKACHGTPTEADFTLMSPPPGDPAGDDIQDQTDGSILYKIKYGRSAMPAFADLYSDFEIWSLVAYFRSFNPDYTQPKPDMTGIYVPELNIEIDYDYNVDKIIVKVYDKDQPLDSAETAVFIGGFFGDLLLDRKLTKTDGVLYFDVDAQLPGDEEGNATVIVKVSKGYAYKKVTASLKILKPKESKSAIEGNHLWSTGANAPMWLKITFFGSIIGVWFVIFLVVMKLRKIKKLA